MSRDDENGRHVRRDPPKASVVQPQDKYVLRLPDGLRDRIKEVAAKNNRSMNAEIIATLEEKYPPKFIDVSILAEFLNSLMAPFADEDHEAYDRYIAGVNDLLAKMDSPWTIKAGWDGVIKFYPYPTRADKEESED